MCACGQHQQQQQHLQRIPLHQIENQRQSNYCNDQATATNYNNNRTTATTSYYYNKLRLHIKVRTTCMLVFSATITHTHTPMYVLCCAAEGAATAALCRGVHCARYSFGCSRTVHTYTHILHAPAYASFIWGWLVWNIVSSRTSTAIASSTSAAGSAHHTTPHQ